MVSRMSIMEICLLVIGGIVFVVSFLIPDKKSSGIGKEDQKLGEEQITKIIDRQMKESKKRLEGVVEETLDYAVEKTERAVERISNEKIMAVNEYSDTVLEEINKNHQEVMFLYDMLNDKHKNIKNTAMEVDKTVKAAEEKAKETEERLKEAKNQTAPAKTAIDILREQQLQNKVNEEEEKEDLLRSSAAEKMIQALGAKRIKTEQKEEAFAPLTPGKVSNEEHVLDSFVESIEKQEAEEREIQQFQNMTNEMPVTAAKKKSKSASVQVPDVNIQFMPGNDSGKNNNEKVLALYKEGKSNIAIAKELGMGVGEVNLVINLFKGAH